MQQLFIVTMDAFADIPAAGDALVYASEEELEQVGESDVDSVEDTKDGKFRFMGNTYM